MSKRSRNVKGGVYKISSFFITSLVIMGLILAGPAGAVSVKLGNPNDAVAGQDVIFPLSVKIEDGDSFLPVKYTDLRFRGPEGFEQLCRVHNNGSITPVYDQGGVYTVSYRYGDGGLYSNSIDAGWERGDNHGEAYAFDVRDYLWRQGVIAFPEIIGNNEGQVPLGASIIDANLTVYVNSKEGLTKFTISQITGNNTNLWKEYETTPELRFNESPWDTLGGDYKDGMLVEFKKGLIYEPVNIDVISHVQNWADGEENQGWHIKTNEPRKVFAAVATREYFYDKRPLLEITYEVESEGPGCDMDLEVYPTFESDFGYGYGYGYDSGNGYGYNFGYGYGYGPGNINYKVIWHTENETTPGDYDVKAFVFAENEDSHTYESNLGEFEIFPLPVIGTGVEERTLNTDSGGRIVNVFKGLDINYNNPICVNEETIVDVKPIGRNILGVFMDVKQDDLIESVEIIDNQAKYVFTEEGFYDLEFRARTYNSIRTERIEAVNCGVDEVTQPILQEQQIDNSNPLEITGNVIRDLSGNFGDDEFLSMLLILMTVGLIFVTISRVK